MCQAEDHIKTVGLILMSKYFCEIWNMSVCNGLKNLCWCLCVSACLALVICMSLIKVNNKHNDHIYSSKSKMQTDQDVQKNQSDDQKENADKKSDTEEMEVCEFTHLHMHSIYTRHSI